MQFQPMKIAALLFFVAMPIFMLLGMIDAFAASGGLNKAVTFFEVLAFGSLALMIGLAIWQRTGLRFDFTQQTGTKAPGTASPHEGPDGGFSA